ncbi:hypothetical protein ACU4GD_20230 [Cupriavidus basilensis]
MFFTVVMAAVMVPAVALWIKRRAATKVPADDNEGLIGRDVTAG